MLPRATTLQFEPSEWLRPADRVGCDSGPSRCEEGRCSPEGYGVGASGSVGYRRLHRDANPLGIRSGDDEAATQELACPTGRDCLDRRCSGVWQSAACRPGDHNRIEDWAWRSLVALDTLRALATGCPGCPGIALWACGAGCTLVSLNALSAGSSLGASRTLIALRPGCARCALGTCSALGSLVTGGPLRPLVTWSALVTLSALATCRPNLSLGALRSLVTLRASSALRAGCPLGSGCAGGSLRSSCALRAL